MNEPTEPEPSHGRLPLDYARPGTARRRTFWLLAIAIAMLCVIAAGMVWNLLPPPPRDHGWSPRLKCVSHMKQIGLAMMMYANDNGHRFPDRLEDLLLTQDITPDVFVCPSGTDTPAAGPTKQVQAANLSAGGHLSYVYRGKGLTDMCPADTVLLYEPPSHHGGGMNVLFGDGRVEFLNAPSAQRLLIALAATTRPVTRPEAGPTIMP